MTKSNAMHHVKTITIDLLGMSIETFDSRRIRMFRVKVLGKTMWLEFYEKYQSIYSLVDFYLNRG